MDWCNNMFDPVRFAMARKQELMNEIEEKADRKEDRVIPPGAAAIIIEPEDGTEFICIRLVYTAGVEQEGGDVPIPTMVALQALRLLQADMDAVEEPFMADLFKPKPQEPS